MVIKSFIRFQNWMDRGEHHYKVIQHGRIKEKDKYTFFHNPGAPSGQRANNCYQLKRQGRGSMKSASSMERDVLQIGRAHV